MREKIRIILPISIIIAVIGVILLLIGNFINESIIDLYSVNFDNFEFKKDQTYSYEVEILDDYFYKRRFGGKSRTQYYYYNARIKNKYSDDIYVVYELNTGARTNMIKSGDTTFKRKGIIRKNTNNINKYREKTLDNLKANRNSKIYDIYFGLSTKDNLKNVGILFLVTSVALIIIIAPLSYLVDKKVKFKKEV